MIISRRRLLTEGTQAGALAAMAAGLAANLPDSAEAQEQAPLPKAFDALQPLVDRVHPIRTEEFQARMARAQQLMAEVRPAFDGLYVTPGTSLYYFTGVKWWPSERLLALVLPRKGEPIVVCPAFEADRLREQLRWPIEIRTWHEDENPYTLAARAFADRGVRTGRVGIEETTRFVFFDGLRAAAPGLECASASPVTIGCRARKSPAEIELMRLANHATVDCYRATFASLREGMTESEVASLVERGFQRMRLGGDVIVLFGQWTARPHGTTTPQRLREGNVVLLDDGTSVEGYPADCTRTGVFGKPADKHRRAFDTVRKAQDAALAAAQRGKLTGSVDDAARAVITAAGYGKDYEVFTHRVGHGIGLDGHEHPYLVRGSRTVLESGMTFSDEPGIYLRGDFGLRLEDIMAVEENGPARLLTPGFSQSLEHPCG
jgi:Xaa-Pro dipeptidase